VRSAEDHDEKREKIHALMYGTDRGASYRGSHEYDHVEEAAPEKKVGNGAIQPTL
jgi:hypothetical protein